jgi:hypothetical protein
MHSKLTFSQIYRTLMKDLIGKDSHRGITLTYGWMANQVGHFSLGFIPTFVHYHVYGNAFHAFLLISLFWLSFEVMNALSPLFKVEYKGNGLFNVKWPNLILDTLTDLSFFWFGSFTFYLMVNFSLFYLGIELAAFILLFFAISYWFQVKLYQQNAFYPFQFRLSQWNKPLKSQIAHLMKANLARKDSGFHYLVFGKKGSGKTTLMVGLSNEYSIVKQKCTYTTFSKWINLLQEDTLTLKSTSLSLWDWTESNFLVIDDINPGSPLEANKYSSDHILQYVSLTHGDRNKTALCASNVAWVIGEFNQDDNEIKFVENLKRIGVDPEKIIVIDLDAF